MVHSVEPCPGVCRIFMFQALDGLGCGGSNSTALSCVVYNSSAYGNFDGKRSVLSVIKETTA